MQNSGQMIIGKKYPHLSLIQAKNPEKGTKYRQTWSKQKDPITNQPGESIAVQNHMVRTFYF